MEGERKSPGDAEIERLSSSDDYWAWRDEALGLFAIVFGILQLKQPFINGCLGFQAHHFSARFIHDLFDDHPGNSAGALLWGMVKTRPLQRLSDLQRSGIKRSL